MSSTPSTDAPLRQRLLAAVAAESTVDRDLYVELVARVVEHAHRGGTLAPGALAARRAELPSEET